jgi:hypothetical protein
MLQRSPRQAIILSRYAMMLSIVVDDRGSGGVMVWGGDRVELGPGDVVSLRGELKVRDVAVPVGTRGTVLDIDGGDGGVRRVEVELPVIVGGRQGFVVTEVARTQVWLQWQFAPAKPSRRLVREVRPPARGDWSRLTGELVVSRGARLKEAVQVGPGEALAGLWLPVGIHGTVVAYDGKKHGEEVFTVSFALPGAGYHAHNLTNVTLHRRQFDLADPALACRIQDLGAGPGAVSGAASR